MWKHQFLEYYWKLRTIYINVTKNSVTNFVIFNYSQGYSYLKDKRNYCYSKSSKYCFIIFVEDNVLVYIYINIIFHYLIVSCPGFSSFSAFIMSILVALDLIILHFHITLQYYWPSEWSNFELTIQQLRGKTVETVQIRFLSQTQQHDLILLRCRHSWTSRSRGWRWATASGTPSSIGC